MPPNNPNTNPGADHPPPPPYTETDIFSVSGGARSHRASSSAASAHSDDAIVLTPPETPASTYQPHFAAPNPEGDSLTTSSAQAYFESRPAPLIRLDPEESLIHEVSVSRDSRQADFPYQPEWAARDVGVQDWQTFVNHLIPHHAERSGPAAAVDEKLRTEGGSHVDDDDARSQTLDNESMHEPAAETEKEPEWRLNATATVAEWNDGFFAPRGITIFLHLSPPPAGGAAATEPHVPGAWDAAFDAAPGDAARGGRPGRFGRFRSSGNGGDDNSNNNNNQPRRGFSFGGITVDGDRVSIGNALHVDRNGVRVGGINVPLPGQHNHAFGGMRGYGGPPPPGFGPWGPFGREGGPFGREGGPFGRDGGPFGRGGPFGLGGGPFGPGRGEHCGGRGGRGRSRGRHGGRRRDTSTSSSSSSSSSSSTSSDSVQSVGSLPPYEDLRDSQLPVTKEFLQRWLEHPDQPVTKESVKQMKEKIKAAKNDASASAFQAGPSSAAPQFDRVALRKEVKAMMAEWRTLKKTQRKLARQAKKERRAAKKQAKRERREGKRQVRKERREARRQDRRGGWDRGERDEGEDSGPGRRGHGHGHHGRHGGHGGHGHGPPGFHGHGMVPPVAMPTPHAPPAPPAVPATPNPPAPPAPPVMPGFGRSGFPTEPAGPFPIPTGAGHPFGPPAPGGPPPRGGLFGRGSFFDRFGGQGFRGGPPGYFPFDNSGPFGVPPPAPGAWPSDKGQEAGVQTRAGETAGPHRGSSARYAAAEELEREIERKEKELWALHERIAREDEEGRGQGKGDEKVVSENARKAREVEAEVKEMGRRLERVRIEADAEFARELAELEVAMG
ncbi:hypothetical protein NKR19_g3818 [Coniochaeta hoffmannii]|uniref:Uncharacterized protein n=1 Tax=Coniochaeta hoffmannii TaxID=91930 RepID=A0AA38W0E9_9PEZI|nr:hypothetical protein NKR19_g3818 [Coniochaeta hoffmannii]